LDFPMKLIDYQLVRYASPITDLIYSIYLSTNKEFRSKNLTDLLETYFKEFQGILSNFPMLSYLNAKVNSWDFETLCKEFNDFKDFGILISTVFYPILFYSSDDVTSNVMSDRISIDNMSPEER